MRAHPRANQFHPTLLSLLPSLPNPRIFQASHHSTTPRPKCPKFHPTTQSLPERLPQQLTISSHLQHLSLLQSLSKQINHKGLNRNTTQMHNTTCLIPQACMLVTLTLTLTNPRLCTKCPMLVMILAMAILTLGLFNLLRASLTSPSLLLLITRKAVHELGNGMEMARAKSHLAMPRVPAPARLLPMLFPLQ